MRSGYEVYAGYLPNSMPELESAKEVVLPVKDMERLETRMVRARVSDTPEPGWHDLWVRRADRSIAEQPLAIQILGEVDDDPPVPERRDIEVSAVEVETMAKVRRWGGPRYARYSGDGYLGGYFVGQPVPPPDAGGRGRIPHN